MTEFLLFCLATVGMTSIIVQGVIFQPFRQYIGDWADKVRIRREEKAQATGKPPIRALIEWFSELIHCAQCTGFWCGLFCGSIFFLPSEHLSKSFTYGKDSVLALDQLLYPYYFFMIFCCGWAGSFLSAFGCNAMDWMFYRKMNALRQLEEQDLILADHRAHLATHQEHEHHEQEHDH